MTLAPRLRRLPDEMVHEILSQVLDVPSHHFLSQDYKSSPFARYELSTSSVLLVCKQWLRVATPLLYATVVLRCKAQTQALERTLRSNRFLGRFIRQIRIEGGYGASLCTIFKHANNVSDLWLNFVVDPSESSATFIKGLSFINPKRLILVDTDSRGHSFQTRMCRALANGIRKWGNLIEFYFGFESSEPTPFGQYLWNRVRMVMEALADLSTLQYIQVTPSNALVSSLCKIAKLPNLTMIHVKGDPSTCPAFAAQVQENEKLSQKIVYDGRDLGLHSTPSTPHGPEKNSATPDTPKSVRINIQPLLEADPSIQVSVWERILGHAMWISEEETLTKQSHHITTRVIRQVQALKLLHVSKAFHKILLPVLYSMPVLLEERQLAQLGHILHQKHWGHYIRMLLVGFHFPSDDFRFIISQAPNLVELAGYHGFFDLGVSLKLLDIHSFAVLATTSGHCLQRLSHPVNYDFTVINLPILLGSLSSFVQLRSLVWASSGAIDFSGIASIPRDALPMLEDLVYASPNTSFSFLLSLMNLPSLSRLEFPSVLRSAGAKFILSAHGRKLKFLKIHRAFKLGLQRIQTFCPNVKELLTSIGSSGVPWSLPPVHSQPEEHGALQIIRITYDIPSQDACGLLVARGCLELLHEMDFSEFTSLKEIQLLWCTWPLTQRAIDLSPWVPLAEKIIDRWNIKVSDNTDKGWRTRLKPIKH